MPRLALPALLLCLFFAACAAPQKSPGPPLFPAASANEDALLLSDGSDIVHLKQHYLANVGDTFDLDLQRDMQLTLTVDDSKPGTPPDIESQTIRTQSAGRLVVSAVDVLQHPAGFSFTVSKLQGAKAEDLLPPGSIIDISNSPHGEVYSLRGGKLGGDVQLAVRSLLAGALAGGLDIDPQKPLAPRKIGDTWTNDQAPPVTPVSPVKPGGPTVEFTDLHGQTTLKAIEIVDRHRTLRLEGDSTGKFKMQGLPLGFSASASDMKTTQSLLISVDSDLPPLEQTVTMDMHISLQGSILFVPVKMNMTTLIHQTQTLTPVQKGSGVVPP